MQHTETATLSRQWDRVITLVMEGAEPRDLLMEYADYLAAELTARGVSAVETMGLLNDEDPGR